MADGKPKRPPARGSAEAPARGERVETQEVVTAFLEAEGRILLVRRSEEVGSYQGLWSGISGYLEDAPLGQVLTEIREETGLEAEQVELQSCGDALDVNDPASGLRWRVHPFLFRVCCPEAVRLDWENVEYRWVPPEELLQYPTVPGLEEVFKRCRERRGR